jgi:hypothetical protein
VRKPSFHSSPRKMKINHFQLDWSSSLLQCTPVYDNKTKTLWNEVMADGGWQWPLVILSNEKLKLACELPICWAIWSFVVDIFKSFTWLRKVIYWPLIYLNSLIMITFKRFRMYSRKGFSKCSMWNMCPISHRYIFIIFKFLLH